MLDEIAASGQARGVRVKTVAIHSDHVAQAVIDTARTTGSNLIVMASHGRKGLKKLLLGSETQHVLTHTELPVLILR
jgi:nucleotide-binding universal stress UspA family protein